MSKQGQDNIWQRLSRAIGGIGGNRTVITLSVARMGDAIGNSVLFIIIPLYVAQLPSPAVNLFQVLRTGILIATYRRVQRPGWEAQAIHPGGIAGDGN